MPNENEQVKSECKQSEDEQRSPSFWAFHPMGRGLSTGLLHSVLTLTTRFSTGFIYGAMSGVFNIAVRSAMLPVEEKMRPEKKALIYYTASIVPWVASAAVMHKASKMSHAHSRFFSIHPSAAIATAIVVQCFGYANKDLKRNSRQ